MDNQIGNIEARAYQGLNKHPMSGKKPITEFISISSGRKLSELPEILKFLPKLTCDEQAEFMDDLNDIRAMGR